MGAAPPTSALTGVPDVDAGASDASAVLLHDVHARFWLGIAIITQFVLLIAYVIYKGSNGMQLPDSQLILGAEIGFVSVVLNFFFGSSSGSVTKSASKSASKSTNGESSTQTTSSP